jgi:hypothetical protein
MKLPIGPAYRRDAGNLPELRRINMFAESAPTESGSVLQSRPGLTEQYSIGAGPVQGLFALPGVFGGDVFALSANELYRGQTGLGSVSGSGPVSFAASQSQLLVARGGGLSLTTGGAVASVSFPDSASVRSITFVGERFVAARDGTGRFYWSDTLNGSAWDGLAYATAESSADELLDVFKVGEELWLVGETTVEPWFFSGTDPDAPYTRASGRLYQRGSLGTGCSAVLDNTLFTVGNDRIVYRFGQVPQRVSDHGIEERIQQAETVAAFAYEHEGHKFFVVRLNTGSWALDVATGQWAEFQTGGSNWIVGSAVSVDGSPLFGSSVDGKVYAFGGWTDDGVALERVFTAAAPLDGEVVPVNRLRIAVNVGQTELLTGLGYDPEAEMRFSRDFETFSDWDTAPLGQQGEYRTLTEWRALGMFDQPGMLFEFRTSAPVPFRVSAVSVNEGGGGRSR